MSAASSKSRAKKSMRVATIFTGVAAFTAGMAQAANAQDTHAAVRPTSKNVGRVVRPAGVVDGHIRYVSGCIETHSVPTWFHYTVEPTTVIDDYCFGYSGAYYSPPGVGLVSQCGGNNHGDLTGAKGGLSVSTAYGPGTTYRTLNWSHFYLITIESWTGGDECKS
jgi:hypothetical protein